MNTAMTKPRYPKVQLFIAGEWRQGARLRTRDVLNPANGEVVGTVACAEEPDLNRAVQAAESGFRLWSNLPALERALIMREAARLVRERTAQIAEVMTVEQGKPIAEAKIEVQLAADITEWFADEGRRIYGRVVPSRNINSQQLVTKEPVGPVAAFTPWNFPVNQIIRKLCAALAAGCSIVIKAPEETPASPAALIQAFVDAGVPPGVINLVYGDPAQISAYLIAHPGIRKVTFTGSTSVGKQLATMAGQHMTRTTMELGGHAPVIVAADADIERAARILSGAKFRNAGQVCISPTRFLVHEDIATEFTSAFLRNIQQIKVGDGLAEGTTMGPLANSRRVTAMERLTHDALNRGATIEVGGVRLSGDGNFFGPTVLTNLPIDAAVFNEEPFGPMVAMRRFAHLDDAIAEANRLPYGLAAYAFTDSFQNIHKLSRRLEVGLLWINQPATPFVELPFGGVKDSGYGSEGGPEALESYLNTKTVAISAR
jgi:succinate-semialdehyde dehydrogenase / glutarate-semialdehyde dehydrogenase